MANQSKAKAIVPLFIPYVLSVIFSSDPILSYWMAWLGSWFIFYWTLFSPSKYHADDMNVSSQIMRPIFLIQLIFGGFMASTSVFYFLAHLGYVNFAKPLFSIFYVNDKTFYISECQRLCVLGHAALAAGIITLIKKGDKNLKFYQISSKINIENFLVKFTILLYVSAFIVQRISAIAQFSISLYAMAIFSGAFILVKGWINKNTKLMLVGGGLFLYNFILSTLTGFKEHILVNFIILGCILFPFYKRLVLIIGIPTLYLLFYILPTYVEIVRSQSWSGDTTEEVARSEAFETVFDSGNETTIDDTNWSFLTGRLSEIGMFIKFVESTPKTIDFYGFEILENSLYALVPRFLWKDKPITERLAMQRVYNAGAVSELSSVSAKTRPVVDAYLSFGWFGVFVLLYLYGIWCQYLCNKAEMLYGGYQFGTMIIFNGIFQILWRGNNFEFIINSSFYGFVLLLILHKILVTYNVLVKIEPSSKNQIIV
jgi:hypothetical protein